MPRTALDRIVGCTPLARGAGSSSSEESTKRLLNAGRLSSSSLESSNLLDRFGAFCFVDLGAERPNPPKLRGDLAREDDPGPRRVGTEPEELRIELRMCVGVDIDGAPPLLNGRGAVDLVGERDRRLKRLEAMGD